MTFRGLVFPDKGIGWHLSLRRFMQKQTRRQEGTDSSVIGSEEEGGGGVEVGRWFHHICQTAKENILKKYNNNTDKCIEQGHNKKEE